MARGGARPNAGRKRGSPDRIAQAKAVVQKHAEDIQSEVPADIAGMTPLQVMLRAMSLAAANGKWPAAAGFAKEAAPYVHPKLATIEMNALVRRSTDLSDDELAVIAATGGTGDSEEEGG